MSALLSRRRRSATREIIVLLGRYSLGKSARVASLLHPTRNSKSSNHLIWLLRPPDCRVPRLPRPRRLSSRSSSSSIPRGLLRAASLLSPLRAPLLRDRAISDLSAGLRPLARRRLKLILRSLTTAPASPRRSLPIRRPIMEAGWCSINLRRHHPSRAIP
jgi:hypothetical protein